MKWTFDMAIQFARTEIIKAEAGSSAVGLSAYITREDRRAEATDTAYAFEHRDDDLVFSNVYLPEGAPQWMRHGRLLWNAAEDAEITKDRKTREIRFKKNAQLAKHTVLALPKELDIDEQQELLEKFISTNYTRHGVAVEAAIHAPHEDGDNWHAHIIETTRVIKKDGLGKKARHLNPIFFKGTAYGDAIGARWGEHQNVFFKEKGMDLRVDPTTAIPSVQLRNGRFIEANEKQKVNEQRRNKNIQLILRNPEVVADHLTHKKPFFTEREVSRYLFKAGLDGQEFDKAKAGVLAHGVALYDRKTERFSGKFTTKLVREQEILIMRRASNLVSRNNL